MGWMMNTEKVTRLEVIDSNGRSYVNSSVSNLGLSMQDDDKTLKVFCDGHKGDFIPDLEWELSEDKQMLLFDNGIFSGSIYVDESYPVRLYGGSMTLANSRYIDLYFNTLEEAKAWANEQYKAKVREVLGL